MENASKALLIAGGILLAMLTIATLVLLKNNLQELKTAESEKKYQDQLTAFNMEYEAYHKNIMYGTDVISVINKAIDNNLLMNKTQPEDPYYINIEFEIITDMHGYREIITETADGKEHKNESLGDDSLNIGSYVLGNVGEEYMDIDDDLLNFFRTEATSTSTTQEEIVDGEEVITTTTIYPAIINFKKAVFTCTGVEYSDEGRVDLLTFRQVD